MIVGLFAVLRSVPCGRMNGWPRRLEVTGFAASAAQLACVARLHQLTTGRHWLAQLVVAAVAAVVDADVVAVAAAGVLHAALGSIEGDWEANAGPVLVAVLVPVVDELLVALPEGRGQPLRQLASIASPGIGKDYGRHGLSVFPQGVDGLLQWLTTSPFQSKA